jgi:hypothetical protein
MKTRYFSAIAAMLFFVAGCSSGVNLPEQMKGVWRSEKGDGPALKFVQNGSKGEVHWAMSAKPEEQGMDWTGPIELQSTGANAWTFELKPVVKTEGNNTSTKEPPSFKQNIQYVIDQNGRRLQRSFDVVDKDHKVTVTMEGDKLILDGLWVRVEVSKWAENGTPDKMNKSPLKTTYIKSQ